MNMIALNERLGDAKERCRQYQWLRDTLAKVEKDLDSQRTRLAKLKDTLHKESSDVDRLEGLSLTGLFLAVLGTKEQQLEEERQEYLLAKLKYDQCKDAVSGLEREVVRLQSQIEELGDVEAHLSSILAEKEQAILRANDDNTSILLRLTEEFADAKADLKEVQEAIAAGETALKALDDTAASLGSARGWGAWDMLGGGLLATAVKHHRIDQARASAHRAQQSLRLFVHELRDVDQGLPSELDIELGSLLSFADYLFDGLIVDWIVQARINDSQQRTVETKVRLNHIVSQLCSKRERLRERLRAIDNEKKAVIEKA